MVHLDLLCADGGLTELLSGQLRALPVALGHLGAGHAELAGLPLWQQVALAVEHQGHEVVERTSDGDVVIVSRLIYLEIGGIYGELRWPVEVQHASGRIRNTRHLLSANADIVQIQRLSAAEQLSKLGGEASSSDGVVCQILAQQSDVHAGRLWYDIHGSADGQHGVEVLPGGIEGEVTVAGDAALGRQLQLLADAVHVVHQRLVLDHHPLGLTRRS